LRLQQPAIGGALGLLAHRTGVAFRLDSAGLGLLLRLLALVLDRFDIGPLHCGVIDRLTKGIGVLHVGQLEIGNLEPPALLHRDPELL
jgi:hypothetical protein